MFGDDVGTADGSRSRTSRGLSGGGGGPGSAIRGGASGIVLNDDDVTLGETGSMRPGVGGVGRSQTPSTVGGAPSFTGPQPPSKNISLTN